MNTQNFKSSKSAVDMSGPAATFVRESIKQQKVVIFSKTYCPYCTMAKSQFKKINVPFLAIEIENRADCNEIQDVLQEMTGARSVPRVFVNEKFIGGGNDVKKLNENGQLLNMCQ